MPLLWNARVQKKTLIFRHPLTLLRFDLRGSTRWGGGGAKYWCNGTKILTN